MSNDSPKLRAPLTWFVAAVLLGFVAYELYSGIALKKVGIPGVFEVEFAEPGGSHVRTTQTTKDAFFLAGMRVSCDIPVSFNRDVVQAQSYSKDSRPATRLVAAAVVNVTLRNVVLEKGELGHEYECTFDDPTYYAKVVALDPIRPGARPRCRAYRQTVMSYGKKITSDGTACSDENGIWNDQKAG